jgi:hypothetical protein
MAVAGAAIRHKMTEAGAAMRHKMTEAGAAMRHKMTEAGAAMRCQSKPLRGELRLYVACLLLSSGSLIVREVKLYRKSMTGMWHV